MRSRLNGIGINEDINLASLGVCSVSLWKIYCALRPPWRRRQGGGLISSVLSTMHNCTYINLRSVDNPFSVLLTVY